ncbi:MAG: hypothetical protein FGM57_00155 [Candidatus Taylorbacteria bacterium]|nr:hypothetical protein [Candidatus Taylorbacteria bacterium]
MAQIIFSEYKEKIKKAIDTRSSILGINEPVSIIDGFVNQPIQNDLSGSFVIGGPTIPMVMLVGSHSGRVYYFALKALIPDINL